MPKMERWFMNMPAFLRGQKMQSSRLLAGQAQKISEATSWKNLTFQPHPKASLPAAIPAQIRASLE